MFVSVILLIALSSIPVAVARSGPSTFAIDYRGPGPQATQAQSRFYNSADLGSGGARADLIIEWNRTVLQAIMADKTPPPFAARNLAMVHAAMYDAVNVVYRTHRPYLFAAAAPDDTSAEVAAAIAAHRVLIELYPRQIERFDATLDACCARQPDGPAKVNGVLLGRDVAEKMMSWRKGDGVARRSNYAPRTIPGCWQPTLPGREAALLPQWPQVLCFAMKRGDQFRPPAPPELTSREYTTAFDEVKALGSVASKMRTAEQTEIARFWADGAGTATPPGHWNRIAQGVALSRGNTLSENARLFALLNIALADAAITAWDAKFAHDFWRPIEAIRRADEDGNPETLRDPGWLPLLPTPPFPSYTSGHSTFSAAAAAILELYCGTDAWRFTTDSEGLPEVTRTFPGFRAAAAEAGKSRIYGGIHYEFDNAWGLASGRAVGEYVYRNFLLPSNHRDTETQR
jgi:hypothetical protein